MRYEGSALKYTDMIISPAPSQAHSPRHAVKVRVTSEAAEQTGENDRAASFGIFGKPDLEVFVLLLGKATVGDNDGFGMSQISNRQGVGLDDRVVLLNLAAETFVKVVKGFALIPWA